MTQNWTVITNLEEFMGKLELLYISFYCIFYLEFMSLELYELIILINYTNLNCTSNNDDILTIE